MCGSDQRRLPRLGQWGRKGCIKSSVKAVWIDVCFIGCQSCANSQAEIFSQTEARAEILGVVRADGRTSDNDEEKSELNEHGQLLSEQILDAAAGCPVEAIRVSMIP
jgi:ferredoxin